MSFKGCPRCAKTVPVTAAFCEHCGAALAAPAPAAVQPASAAAAGPRRASSPGRFLAKAALIVVGLFFALAIIGALIGQQSTSGDADVQPAASTDVTATRPLKVVPGSRVGGPRTPARERIAGSDAIRVSSADFPGTWPLTVSAGILRCDNDGPRKAVRLELPEKRIQYGINGAAKTLGFPDSVTIEKAGTVGVDMRTLIQLGLTLCD